MNKELIKEIRQSIKEGNLEKIKTILNNDKDLISISTFFGTWLHDASTYGKYDIIQYLIECGVDVNKKGGVRDAGPITYAAFKGFIKIVELLCDNGATLDTSNCDRNPLFAAIYNGHFNVVKYLVENGIDITASYPIGQLENVDAYEYARQYGQTEIANYLKTKLNEM